MPNWVHHVLTIKDEKVFDEVANFITTNNNEILNALYPIPDYIYKGLLGMDERDLYGDDNWYDWCIKNWGTKWDTCRVSIQNDTIEFDTAWSPVPKMMGLLSQKFQGSEFELIYADEDVGSNTAHFKFKDGKIIEYDIYYNGSISAFYTYFKVWNDRFIGPGSGYYLCTKMDGYGKINYCPVERIR